MVTPPIKKRAAKAAVEKLQESRARKAVTTTLDEANYRDLKHICSVNGWGVSDVLDQLVSAFLEEWKNETTKK